VRGTSLERHGLKGERWCRREALRWEAFASIPSLFVSDVEREFARERESLKESLKREYRFPLFTIEKPDRKRER
jgi:hypothetical protein